METLLIFGLPQQVQTKAKGNQVGQDYFQGEWQADGSILWQNGWTMAANSKAQDTELIGTDLYISSTPTGLYKLTR